MGEKFVAHLPAFSIRGTLTMANGEHHSRIVGRLGLLFVLFWLVLTFLAPQVKAWEQGEIYIQQVIVFAVNESHLGAHNLRGLRNL